MGDSESEMAKGMCVTNSRDGKLFLSNMRENHGLHSIVTLALYASFIIKRIYCSKLFCRRIELEAENIKKFKRADKGDISPKIKI